MAYRYFDPAHPDPTQDNGAQVADFTRWNLLANRDAVVMGLYPQWDEDVVGPDPMYPEYIQFKSGIEVLRMEYDYNAEGFTSQITLRYSKDDGNVFEVIGVYTPLYDANNIWIGGRWS